MGRSLGQGRPFPSASAAQELRVWSTTQGPAAWGQKGCPGSSWNLFIILNAHLWPRPHSQLRHKVAPEAIRQKEEGAQQGGGGVGGTQEAGCPSPPHSAHLPSLAEGVSLWTWRKSSRQH